MFFDRHKFLSKPLSEAIIAMTNRWFLHLPKEVVPVNKKWYRFNPEVNYAIDDLRKIAIQLKTDVASWENKIATDVHLKANNPSCSCRRQADAQLAQLKEEQMLVSRQL